MNYMFILIVTLKFIRKKLTKLQEVMGLQPSQAGSKQRVQLLLKAKEDTNDSSNNDNNSDTLEPSLIFRALGVTDPYDSWMVKYPSALRSFDRLMKAASGKRMVIFLDYDGTLSPIVDHPDRAFMSEEMRAAVREVGEYFPTAIISGRSRAKVKEFVKLDNVYYAGSHGMDIVAPSLPIISSDASNTNGKEIPFQPAKEFLPAVREILTLLESKARVIKGARVEDNGFCVSVHFRQVQEQDYAELEEIVKSVLEKYPEFCLTEGKKVMEIRPSIEWNKGHALEYFLDTLGLSCSGNILPVYVGDDRTDEDAFKVLRSRGQGYPIIVSSVPKDTKALYSLRDPSEVLVFLSRLAKWRKTSCSSKPFNFG